MDSPTLRGESVPPTGERQRAEPVSEGSGLLATLRWLGRKLSGLVRWVAKRLRAPLRPIARLLMLRWAAKHLPAPLRGLGRLFAPGRERGFGFWWLVATLAVAVALGMVVALLLTPVAGLIALLVVAIWALVRRRRHKRHDAPRDAETQGVARLRSRA
jgi:cobalamin synthase